MEEQYGWDTKDEFPDESTEFPSSRRVKTLYLYSLEEWWMYYARWIHPNRYYETQC